MDNETCFSSLWVQETGVLRSVVQSPGGIYRTAAVVSWCRNCERGTEAVGAMKFGDSCIVALRLTMFGTLVTYVSRIWEFYFSLTT